LTEEYSEGGRRVRHQPVHVGTEAALVYLVGALAEAPASARVDASRAADRMASAMTMLLYTGILLSFWVPNERHVSDGGAFARMEEG
jgi:hypothetical protein